MWVFLLLTILNDVEGKLKLTISLTVNTLVYLYVQCRLRSDGMGIIGLTAIADALRQNTSLTEFEYVRMLCVYVCVCVCVCVYVC